jgi:uncharacterized protein YkwD
MENIAWTSSNYYNGMSLNEIAKSVFMQWKNSPGHYKNMIKPDLNCISVAGVFCGGGNYFTMVGMKKN